jgi:hypothetical protein
MSFKKSSPRVERERPLGGFARQARETSFGIARQSVVRVWKRIQNPPRQQRQNVIAQVVSWEKLDPTTKMVKTLRTPTDCNLRQVFSSP